MMPLVKRVVYAAGIVLVFLLSFVVPKKKGLCVFGSMFGNAFSGNTKYVFMAAKDAVWLTRSSQIAAEVRARGGRAARFAPWLLLRAEYIFINERRPGDSWMLTSAAAQSGRPADGIPL